MLSKYLKIGGVSDRLADASGLVERGCWLDLVLLCKLAKANIWLFTAALVKCDNKNKSASKAHLNEF